MLSNILPADPHDPGGWRDKVIIQNFQNMVMLDIKFNATTNAATWRQMFCPHTPTRTYEPGGQNVKIKLFQNMVMLHIKLKGMMNAATW